MVLFGTFMGDELRVHTGRRVIAIKLMGDMASLTLVILRIAKRAEYFEISQM